MSKIENKVIYDESADSKFDYIINHLKETEPEEYTEENFYTKPDYDRYNNYLKYNILSHSNKSDVSNRVIQREVYNRPFEARTVITPNGVLSIVPEIETLRDEMSCIHEYTHLLNYMSNPKNQDSIYKNIIPTFNEYDYLKQIGTFYAYYYRRLVFNNAIEAANRMNDINKKDCLSYILAYLVLEHRKENYNIQKLNEINCQSKKLDKSLINKGYSF